MAHDPQAKDAAQPMVNGKKVKLKDIKYLQKNGYCGAGIEKEVVTDIFVITSDGTILGSQFEKGNKVATKKEFSDSFVIVKNAVKEYDNSWQNIDGEKKWDSDGRRKENPGKIESKPKIKLLGQDFIYDSGLL